MPLPLTVVPIPGPGAEDVLVADDGRVWTGTADGLRVVKRLAGVRV